jgi:hypothetical protein
MASAGPEGDDRIFYTKGIWVILNKQDMAPTAPAATLKASDRRHGRCLFYRYMKMRLGVCDQTGVSLIVISC